MKRLTILALCAIMMLAVTIYGVNSRIQTESSPQMSDHMEFSSIDELMEYIKSDDASMTRAYSMDSICLPQEEEISQAFGASLQRIEVAENNFYYCFTVSGADIESAAASLDMNQVNEVIGENTATEDIARPCVEDFVIGWFRGSDGDAVLNSLAAGNPLDFWEEHPGYYFTTSPFSDMTEPLGYMIYWVQNGEFFQASVPADKLDTFWEMANTLMETVNY